jgi:tRNA pseudouridine32 synthase/23S rRNA pseudouridine746 synthase
MPADTDPDGADRLPLVFADDTLIVLNKPSGLLSVPGRGPDKQDCLSNRVLQHFADALIVHRLDMSTSGLIVMARGIVAQRQLNDAFANRAVHKRYTAVVFGHLQTPGDAWHTIDLPIVVDWPNRPLRIIDHTRGQASQTRVRCTHFDAARGLSRVALEPITGRSHQLRVHLQATGHPIVGDALYAPAQVAAIAPRLLLHACHLAFAHPLSGAALEFDSPADF